MDVLPEVAEYLKVPHLDRDAARALYAIWHRPSSNDPTVVGVSQSAHLKDPIFVGSKRAHSSPATANGS